MPQLVHYTNADGFEEIRRVPDGLRPGDYSKGILVGPPDVSSLPLKKSKLILLNKLLIDEGFLTKKDLIGNRARLYTLLIKVLELEEEVAREIRNQILLIYQREAIPD